MISQSAPIDDLINISFTAPATDLDDAKKILAAFQEKTPWHRRDYQRTGRQAISRRESRRCAPLPPFFALLADAIHPDADDYHLRNPDQLHYPFKR